MGITPRARWYISPGVLEMYSKTKYKSCPSTYLSSMVTKCAWLGLD